MQDSDLSAPLVEGLAAAIGGVLATAVTHPLLVASTRLQLQARHQAAAAAASLACALPASAEAHASPSAASPAASGRPPAALPSPGAAPAAAPAAPPPPPPLPAGPLAAVLFLGRTEGVRSLYAGLASGCGSLALANALYFTLYALLRDAVLASRRRRARRAPAGSPPPSRPASLGGAAALPVAALAGALNVLATTPLWVVVTRLQAAGAAGVGGGAKRKLSPLAAARAVYAADGLRGFWRGTVPSLCLVANPVVQFAAYEALLARFVASRGPAAAPRPVPPLTGFALAAAAKLAATLVTYPYLVVKTKQQAGGGGGGGGSESGGGARGGGGGTFAELARTAREEGLAGLYAGLGTKLAQTVIAAALLFVTKDAVAHRVRAALLLRARARGRAAAAGAAAAAGGAGAAAAAAAAGAALACG